jgi:hypothetical protein
MMKGPEVHESPRYLCIGVIKQDHECQSCCKVGQYLPIGYLSVDQHLPVLTEAFSWVSPLEAANECTVSRPAAGGMTSGDCCFSLGRVARTNRYSSNVLCLKIEISRSGR